ncbi:hypothetical protein BKA65DRAFT_240087 [Rhexocercosporidium sp. MPI-PUGE-AT-0058]|nr:hypothetical protein BKA65DRAFT_240087 [Rhexocercosporidium sp. MPI-PUGE-AT-0058]
MYSTVRVKEVQIRFLSIKEASNEFEVILIDLDSTSTSRKIKRELDAMNTTIDLGECGVNIMGRSHDPNIRCPNEYYDQYAETYCKVQKARRLEQLEGESKWLPSMLEFYWQSGISTQGAEFLRATDFLVSYKSLQYDRFYNAANPYDKTIRAFKIVEGWRLRYLLLLVVGSLAYSICVVAVIAVARQSLEDGLTTGSYSLALATTCLAVLAFLSAVL